MDTSLIQYLLLGILSGLTAGLFGIGGGIILVPGYDWLFSSFIALPHVMPMALATSLSVIFFSSMLGFWMHLRAVSLHSFFLIKLLPFIVVGALLGSYIASELLVAWMRALFAVVLLYSAYRTLHNAEKNVKKNYNSLTFHSVVFGISIIASMFGIGGGILLMPLLLNQYASVPLALMHTSFVTMMISLLGCLGYIQLGMKDHMLPPYSLGYVYLPAFLITVIPSLVGTLIGVRLATRWSVKKMSNIFAGLLILLALQMLYRFWYE